MLQPISRPHNAQLFLLCLFLLLSPTAMAAEPVEGVSLPWQVGDHIAGRFEVLAVQELEGCVRWDVQTGDGPTTIEVVPDVGSNSEWATRYHRLQPAPGASPPMELLEAALVELATFDDTHQVAPLFVPRRAAGPLEWEGAALPWMGAASLVTLWVAFLLWLRRRKSRPGTGWSPPDQALFALVAVAQLGSTGIGIGSIWNPDEVMQYVEQPFRFLEGLDFSIWEFQQGARNWFYPGVNMGVMWLCRQAGITGSIGLLLCLRIVHKLLFLAGLRMVVGAARETWGPTSATAILLLVGLHPLLFFATNHTLTESFAIGMTLLAFAHLLRARTRGRTADAVAVGLWLALGVATRLQMAALAPVALGYLAWPGQRMAGRSRLLMAGVAAFLGGFCLAGMLDLLTWGGFAHSFILNITVHLRDGASLQFDLGAPPWHYYLIQATAHSPVQMLLFALLMALALRREWANPFFWAALLFIAAHSALIHKEMRYVLPVFPLLLVVCGVGAGALVDWLSMRWRFLVVSTAVLLVALAGWSRFLGWARYDSRQSWPAQAAAVLGKEDDVTEVWAVHGEFWVLNPIAGPCFYFGRCAPYRPAESLAEVLGRNPSDSGKRCIVSDAPALLEELMTVQAPLDVLWTRGDITVLCDPR
jgi:hypothetical protein